MSASLYWLDLFGIAVFAFSGALMAGRYKLDPFGVVVLSSVTAIGGGTIRDVIIQVPVFWLHNPIYLYIILVTAILTIIFVRCPRRIPKRFLLVADAFGLALFAVVGAEKALNLGLPIPVAILMGMITGVAGGMLRDVLCNVIPLILRKEIYATAAILGSALFAILQSYSIAEHISIMVAVFSALSLRLAAIYWRVSLPAFQILEQPNKNKPAKK